MQTNPRRRPRERVRAAGKAGWHPRPPERQKQVADVLRILAQRTNWLGTLIFAVCVVLGPVVADASANPAATPNPSTMHVAGLLLRTPQGTISATTLNTDVNIVANPLVARVSVMQEFVNTSADWVEGVYVFPLPDAAAVDRMRVYIGDRFIEAEIREKEAARKTYEQAREAGRKTGLVEQQRANLFTTSLANIAPGETVIVEIEYLQELQYSDGLFGLRFPLTLTPRYMPGTVLSDRQSQGHGRAADTTEVVDASLISPPMASTSAGHRVSLRASVTAGVPLAMIASRYHPVHISETGGRYAVSLAAGRTPMDHDFELVWQPVASAAPRALLFNEIIDGEPHYLLMVMPPVTESSGQTIMPRELIFIIDTSGSMHGISLDQASTALQRALDRLRPVDLFNVIEFNSHTRPLFGNSMPATPVHVSTAKNHVRQLRSSGGTEMFPALELALSTPVRASHLRQIIFMTDGAVGNEEALFELINTGLGDARLFTVGIGSAPNSWFMRKAAEAGRGTFTIISALPEVGEKMERLFAKLESPQVTGIEVHWPGGSLVDSYPAVVPDLYRGEPVAVRSRGAGAFRSGDSVRVAGDSLAGAWQQELSLTAAVPAPGVAALWARARIAELLDTGRRGGDAEAFKREIVDTALAHRLVSPHTSLVAVDKTPARVSGKPLRHEHVPNLLAQGQSAGAIFGFPGTATNAAMLRRNGSIVLLSAVFLWLTIVLLQRGRDGVPA